MTFSNLQRIQHKKSPIESPCSPPVFKHPHVFVKAEVSYNIRTQSAEEHCTSSKKAAENLRKPLSAEAFCYGLDSAQIKRGK